MSISPKTMELLVDLSPSGWNLDEGSTLRLDLAVVGDGLDLLDGQAVELLDEVLPDRAADLLTSWERVYDLHPPAGRSDADRLLAIQVARKTVPAFTPAWMAARAEELLGTAVTLVEPFAFRCDDATSLCDTVHDVVDGAFMAFITFSETAARAAGSTTRREVDELLGRMKPAHTIVRVECSDFLTDDPWSLCDLDLLGA